MIAFLLLKLSFSATYPKTICACHNCNKTQDDCIGATYVDPLLTTFYEDFDTARENHRQILLYFNEMKPGIVFEFNLAAFSNLEIKFISYDYYSPVILVKYENDVDYTNSNLVFVSIRARFENSDNSAKENILALGHFSDKSSPDQLLEFVKHGNTPIKITAKTFEADLTSLRECASLKVTDITNHTFYVHELAEVKLAVNPTEIYIMAGTAKVNFAYLPFNTITFNGISNNIYSPFVSVVSSTIGDIDTSKTPKFVFKHLSTAKLLGSKPEGIVELYECINIISNGPTFPFTITSDNTHISFTEDAKITGTIQVSRISNANIPNITVDCTAAKRTSVSFPNVLSAYVLVISPYLNVDISYLNASFFTRTMDVFPVIGAVSESQASNIVIHRIDYGPKIGIITKFGVYTDISKQFTDAELKKLAISTGLSFLTFPSQPFIATDGDAYINLYSKTFFNKIQGFTHYVNNLKITEARKDGKTTIAAVWNPDVPIGAYTRYLCIGGNCKAPNSDLTPACYLNVTNMDDLSNLQSSGFANEAIKNYYININKDLTSPIDLSKIPGSDVTINIEGSSSKINVMFTGSGATSIKTLSLKNLTVSSDYTFDVPDLYHDEGVSYAKGVTINYGTNTKLTIMPTAFDTTYKLVKTKLSKLYINGTMHLGVRPFSNQLNLFYTDSKYYIFSKMYLISVGETIFYMNANFFILIDTFQQTFKSLYGCSFQTVGATNLTLNGDITGLKAFNPAVQVYNEHKLNITYTYPHQGDFINISNPKLVSTTVQYENNALICFVDSDKDKCPLNTIKYQTLNITAGLEAISSQLEGKASYTIYMAGPEDQTITLHMSSLNEKYIDIRTYTASKKILMNLVFDVKEIDQEYSFLRLTNINLTTTVSEKVTVKFGAVEFVAYGSITDNFKQYVTVYFHNLKCYYEFLSKFSEIHITDQIQLEYMHESYPLEDEVNIFIGEDKDANDIYAKELETIDITVGKGLIRLDKIIFNLPKTANYDAYFMFGKGKVANITMKCDNEVTFDQFPKITIDTSLCSSTIWNLQGEWFGSDDNNIKFITNKKADIYIDDDMVPLTVTQALEDVTFHFSSNVVGLYGPLYFSGGTYHFVANETVTSKDVKFEVKQGFVVTKESTSPVFIIHDPCTKMTITNSIVLDESIKSASINMVNAINAKESSSITIKENLGDGVMINNDIMLKSLLIGKMDEDSIELIKVNHTIITASRIDFTKIKSVNAVYLQGSDPITMTHGFYTQMNCLGVDLIDPSTGSVGQIVLYKAMMPSEVPFSIDYIDIKSDYIPTGELVIFKDNATTFSNIDKYLPAKLSSIILNIQTDMETANPFIIKKYISTITEIQVQGAQLAKPKGCLTLPTEGNLVISLYNFILVSSTKGAALQCNSINLTNIEFNEKETIKISSDKVNNIITDVDSLGTMLASSIITGQFTNPMTISSCNFITFTEAGWEMRELFFFKPIEVDPSIFSNIVANSSRALELSVKKPGMTSIKGITVNANKMPGVKKVEVQFGRNWEKITNTGNLIVNVGNEEVDAGMASSPVPYIFSCDKSKVNFFYSQDSNAGFDTVTLSNSTLSSSAIKYNFTNLDSKYQVLEVGDIDVSGSSSIEFVDNIGLAVCNNVNVQPNSQMKFNNVTIKSSLTINQGSTVQGQFSFAQPSTLDLHWSLDSSSKLELTPSASSVPGKINIILDDKKVDMKSFNNNFYDQKSFSLISGSFNCAALQDNVNFDSKIAYFKSGDKNVMMTTCELVNGTTNLMLSAAKKYDNALSVGAIAGIVVACVIVVGLIIGLTIYCRMKKQYDTLVSQMPMEMEDPKKEIKY